MQTFVFASDESGDVSFKFEKGKFKGIVDYPRYPATRPASHTVSTSRRGQGRHSRRPFAGREKPEAFTTLV